MLRLKAYDLPAPYNVRVYRATKPEDAFRSAIHLYKPTRQEIASALDTAVQDCFVEVILRGDKTWPRAKQRGLT